jgi:hypothetical protein
VKHLLGNQIKPKESKNTEYLFDWKIAIQFSIDLNSNWVVVYERVREKRETDKQKKREIIVEQM